MKTIQGAEVEATLHEDCHHPFETPSKRLIRVVGSEVKRLWTTVGEDTVRHPHLSTKCGGGTLCHVSRRERILAGRNPAL